MAVMAPDGIEYAVDDSSGKVHASLRHRCLGSPSVGRRIVGLDDVNAAITFASDCIENTVDDADSQPVARGWHGCLGAPSVRPRIVRLDSIQRVKAAIAATADGIEYAVDDSH